MKSLRTAVGLVFISFTTLLVGAHAVAQTTKPNTGAPQVPKAATATETAQAGYTVSSDDPDDMKPATVLKVTSIEVIRSTHPPVLDIIRVRGVTSTDAWLSPELVPLSRGRSPDGVLDMLFVAAAPGNAISPTGYGAVEAIFAMEPSHQYAGVRVRGATNSLTLSALPGYVETAAPLSDCRDCVGKYFQAKGAPAPSGATAGNVVREEDLPANVRIIKPTDGVAKLDTDPNRLTLMLSEDGKVQSALWD